MEGARRDAMIKLLFTLIASGEGNQSFELKTAAPPRGGEDIGSSASPTQNEG